MLEIYSRGLILVRDCGNVMCGLVGVCGGGVGGA